MWFAKLASLIGAGDNKGLPNVVEITSAKLLDADKNKVKFGSVIQKDGQDVIYTDAKGGKAPKTAILAELFQYPQFGPEPTRKTVEKDGKQVETDEYIELTDEQAEQGVQEAIKDAGGVVRFLENYNDATRTAALNAGKNYIRTKEDGDPAKIVETGLNMTRSFTWAAAERISNKSVREGVEALVDKVDDMSPEDAVKALKALLGRKA